MTITPVIGRLSETARRLNFPEIAAAPFRIGLADTQERSWAAALARGASARMTRRAYRTPDGCLNTGTCDLYVGELCLLCAVDQAWDRYTRGFTDDFRHELFKIGTLVKQSALDTVAANPHRQPGDVTAEVFLMLFERLHTGALEAYDAPRILRLSPAEAAALEEEQTVRWEARISIALSTGRAQHRWDAVTLLRTEDHAAASAD